MMDRTYPRIKAGSVFGRLTVTSRHIREDKRSAWNCVCQCGTETQILAQSLKKGATTSCGCAWHDIIVGKYKQRADKIIGQRFSHWLVKAICHRRAKNGGIYFLCVCDCGQEREVASDGLIGGRSKSCGGCGADQKPVCKFGHIVAEWGGRTPSGSCKACVKEKSMMRNYGITLQEYLELWEFQKGKCAICGRALVKSIGMPGFAGTKPGRPEVDHEHGHKEVHKDSVRGILCGGRWAGCNRKLGRIDHIEWLKAVISYLESPPARQVF